MLIEDRRDRNIIIHLYSEKSIEAFNEAMKKEVKRQGLNIKLEE